MMEQQISKTWYMFLIKGLILTVLSVFILFNPEGTLKAVAFYLGLGFIVLGIILAIRNFPAKKEEDTWNLKLIEGIAYLILGLLLIIAPLAMVNIVSILIGIFAAVYGILIIIDSFKTPVNGPLKLVSGVLIFALANILIFKSDLLGLTFVVWFGILLLVAGIYNIYLAVKVKQAGKISV
jgi:uncharacterized membrane protein HdeD (DUF308 family)